jgi:ferric-dicitrate binding protein FerR (iron transport regulator)
VSRESEKPTPTPEPTLHPEAAELTRLARRSLGHLTPTQHARGFAALRMRLVRRGQPSAAIALALGGLGAVAAVALLAPRTLHRAPAPLAALTYQVDEGTVDADGAIRARRDGAPALEFVDGTVIKLAPGTSGRVASVDARGAHVSIREGSAHVSVVPKPQARWLIDAGPFQIAVHGTAFTATWDEASGRLDVRLEHGLVSVTGPVANGPIPVRTGQHLTVTVKEARVFLRDEGADELATAEPSGLEPGAGSKTAGTVVAHGAEAHLPRAARPAPRTWAVALSSGDFEGIVAEAERDLGRALGQRSTDELAALADAARYLRKDDVARRALHAQRRRFPGSPRAADAAFFLGRLDENGGGLEQALHWYDRYLAEAPQGSYAAEALGRKMITVREAAGPAAAREVAGEYVRRFPHGSYAGAAQALRRDSRETGSSERPPHSGSPEWGPRARPSSSREVRNPSEGSGQD